MKELLSVFEELIKDPRWKSKLIIGSLLMFIPIVNLLALGYLLRYSMQARSCDNVTLPAWEEWTDMFVSGLIAFGVFLVNAGSLLFGGWLISEVLNLLTLDAIGTVPYFPLTVAALVAPSMVIIGFVVVDEKRDFWALFRTFKDNLLGVIKHWKELLIPNLAFCGLLFVAAPLYGIAFFIGFLVMIPYTIGVFRNSNVRKHH